jgi:ribosomal protein L35AE/L33A
MQHPTPPPQPNAPGEAPPASLLLALPNELRLQIARELSEWQDRAALCLACPPLGVAAIREIDEYKDPLLAIAIALWQRGAASTVLNEPLFRRYAADDRASEEGCGWLTDAAERHGIDIGFDIVRQQGHALWSLTHMGTERMVRLEFSDGMVLYYEGERGAERMVRAEFMDGKVVYYEGERGAERMVRAEFMDGKVVYCEGERGAERIVRAEFSDGMVQHYEGEQGAERIVRVGQSRDSGGPSEDIDN